MKNKKLIPLYKRVFKGDVIIGKVPYVKNLSKVGGKGLLLGVGRWKGLYYLVYKASGKGDKAFAEVVPEQVAKDAIWCAGTNKLFCQLFSDERLKRKNEIKK